MLRFKKFLENEHQQEEDKDILQTLSKIPKSHAELVKGYTFKFQGGNTLDDDNDHIGYVQDKPKEIVVAAPWNYSRCFTMLHEIAHEVWDHIMSDDLKKEWSKVSKLNPIQIQKNDEENFCMAYANYYSKHKVLTYFHPSWIRFIKFKVPK